MKPLPAIIIMLLSGIAYGQESPVQIDASIKKGDSGRHIIEVNVDLKAGWHIYAMADSKTGIEPFNITYSFPRPEILNITDQSGIETIVDPIFDNEKLQVYKGSFKVKQVIQFSKMTPREIELQISGFASDNQTFLPINKTLRLVPEGGRTAKDGFSFNKHDLSQPVARCGDEGDKGKGLAIIFLLGIGGGLLALLTPCVFPMIPVTVSFFSNKSSDRKGALFNGIRYGLFILLIYLLASVPFHVAGNIEPEIFNTIATSAWVNIFFFIVFILFALSFFGLFEIRLPSSIANKSGSKGGIFFMALTLAIVSFSCTGPILGSLLVGAMSAQGSAWELTAGMGGFGIALGLPFALFAIFPSWLKRIPKSGGWMEVVKKSLAFVELALAIKFLSNADLVQHWDILKREIFIGLWILIAIGLGLYLLGLFDKKVAFQPSTKISISSKKVRQRVAPVRFSLGVLTFIFALYLTPGLTQSNISDLTLLSGFPPPVSYSVYEERKGRGVEPDVVNDLEAAFEIAKMENKPLLIDFTGWACVNCRKMEEHVWTQKSVQTLINDKMVLVSLYVDDRRPSDEGGTIGKKWATFQAAHFGQVTQPLYVMLSPEQDLLTFPIGYTPDINEYRKWLECGLNAFAKLNHKDRN